MTENTRDGSLQPTHTTLRKESRGARFETVFFAFAGPGFFVPSLSTSLEVIWTYGWMLFISGILGLDRENPPLTMVASLTQALVAERLVRLSLRMKWSEKRIRLALLPIVILLLSSLIWWSRSSGSIAPTPASLAYVLSHPRSLVVGFGFGLYLTWRAMRAGREEYSFRDLCHRFFVGLTGTVLLLMIWRLGGRLDEAISSTLTLYVIAYFGIGLMTLASTNLGSLRPEAGRSSGRIRSNVRWLAVLVAVVAAILAFSVSLTTAMRQEFTAAFLRAAHTAGDWLSSLLSLLVIPLAFVVDLLFWGMRHAFSLVVRIMLFFMGGRQPDQPTTIFEPLRAEKVMALPIAADVMTIAKWVIGVALCVAIALLLARSISRRREREATEEVEEVSESLLLPGAFRKEMRGVFSRFVAWVWRRKSTRRLPRRATPSSRVPGETGGDPVSAEEIYRALLRQGGRLGLSRRPSETPYEYAVRLEPQARAAADKVHNITEAFVGERYGGIRTGKEELLFLNRALRDVSKELRESAAPPLAERGT